MRSKPDARCLPFEGYEHGARGPVGELVGDRFRVEALFPQQPEPHVAREDSVPVAVVFDAYVVPLAQRVREVHDVTRAIGPELVSPLQVSQGAVGPIVSPVIRVRRPEDEGGRARSRIPRRGHPR